MGLKSLPVFYLFIYLFLWFILFLYIYRIIVILKRYFVIELIINLTKICLILLFGQNWKLRDHNWRRKKSQACKNLVLAFFLNFVVGFRHSSFLGSFSLGSSILVQNFFFVFILVPNLKKIRVTKKHWRDKVFSWPRF